MLEQISITFDQPIDVGIHLAARVPLEIPDFVKARNCATDLSFDELVIVIAHELGHVLGLGHSADPSALMYPTVSRRGSPVLSLDDLEGLRYLYRPRPEDDGGLSCARIAPEDGPRAGPRALLELAVLLIIGFAGLKISRDA